MIVDRPWGRLATYALNQPVTVRLVTVDPGARTGAHYHRLREEMPEPLGSGFDADHPYLAAAPAKGALVGELAAAAGMKRALLEDHRARPRIHHAGLEPQGLGMLVAEVASHAQAP